MSLRGKYWWVPISPGGLSRAWSGTAARWHKIHAAPVQNLTPVVHLSYGQGARSDGGTDVPAHLDEGAG